MACVIAAPASSSGKTLLSLVLTAWARNKGLSLQPFKVGPDYLDPQYLTAVSQKTCRNLDLILCGPNWVKESFHGFGGSADLALVEGVMGFFDGVGSTENGSTAAIAKQLNLPVVLVVDASGQAASLAALVKGFRDQDPTIKLAGVVLNRISSNRHKALLEEVLAGVKVKMLGWLPKNPELTLPTRHLGLAPAHEIENLKNRTKVWASIAESNLDLQSFIKLLEAPKSTNNPINSLTGNSDRKTHLNQFPIAIAEDNAFHFRYPETKECLEALGMPLIPWRPLENESLPREAKAIILPGGFPEQYAKQLSLCSKSINEIKACFGKRPIYAECGGMLFLGQTLSDLNGQSYPMAGILPFHATKGTLQVGYRNLRSNKRSLLLSKDQTLIGHEFHRWEIRNYSPQININERISYEGLSKGLTPPWKTDGWMVKEKTEGWSNELFHASWIHLHWASQPKILSKWRSALERTQNNSTEIVREKV